MSWTLNATGHCASEEDERALVQEINKVLSADKAGTSASGFNGETHRGPANGLTFPKAKAKAAEKDTMGDGD